MKKLSLLLLILFFALAASGGYGYFLLQNDTEEEDGDEPGSSNPPFAKITPSNPKIQINETISFSATSSTDPDGDDLTFFWSFEGDSKEYEGETIDRNFPDKGEYRVVLKVTDSTGLSDEAETTVLVVEDYHDEDSGTVSGQNQEAEVSIPVENGFVSLSIEYTLERQISGGTTASVTLRLTDADGVVVDEEEIDCSQLDACDGTWSYSSDDLSSIGDYVFSITREEGTVEWTTTIDVKY